MHKYLLLKRASPEERAKAVPRVYIFAGKAAAAYLSAKAIIRLICCCADVVNNDKEIGDLLKVNARESSSNNC